MGTKAVQSLGFSEFCVPYHKKLQHAKIQEFKICINISFILKVSDGEE
jgi:hypothetical protein